jgi:protein SCO1/2
VAFVEATVDPVRDTVPRLAAYQKEFGADWDLWTSTPAQMAAFWKPFGVNYQFVSEEQPAKTDWWTGKPLTYDVLHTDGYILIDANGRERFVNASAPDIPNLSPKLKALLDDSGVHDLTHPQPTNWTTADALTALSWVLGTTVPASGS